MRVELVLKRPHQAQRAVLDCAARFRVMMCGRRFGKSLISQNISIEEGVQRKQVAYVTPTYQLGKIFFQEIIKTIPPEICRKNETELSCELGDAMGGTVKNKYYHCEHEAEIANLS